MAMVKVVTRFVSGYCLHLVGVFAEMYSCIFSLRAHLVVAGVEAGSSSFQFSCLAVFMILCTASSGAPRAPTSGPPPPPRGFHPPAVDSSVPKDSMPSQVAV